VFDEYVDVKVHLTVAEARQVAESLLKVAAVVEGKTLAQRVRKRVASHGSARHPWQVTGALPIQ
jgi:hypothetical protein